MEIPLGLAYDDILLVPQHSEIKSRRNVTLSTWFTRQIPLNMPLVSANMDTVTESAMAIAMAEAGGIGVIHRFLTVDAQISEVSRVKRHQSQVVEDPRTISPESSVDEARHIMDELGISGLPVVDEERRLLGILTRRDLLLAPSDNQVSERMTPWERMVVAPPDVTQTEARATLSQHRLEKLPLVDSHGKLVGLFTAKDLSRDMGLSLATRDDKGRLRVAAAVGVVENFLERAHSLVEADVDALVIDIAHGDSALMLSAITRLRESEPSIPLVAGNVATAEGTQRLIDAGADGVKVGVGPGSMCITRQVAGVGVPQLTAVLECARVANRHGIPLIADGGIRYSGDLAKAIGAGASTVMLGGLLAGTDESPGLVISRDGGKFKVARGMASQEAALDRSLREDPQNGWSRWEQFEAEVPAEGVQAPVPYRGTVTEVLVQLLGGLRSGMSYCNAASIDEMRSKARFIRQTEAGFRESSAHIRERL